MDVVEVLNVAARAATALGVAFATYQVWLARRVRQAAFEERFIERYRSVVARIPLSALLGQADNDTADGEVRRAFFDYFELCAEQVFYRKKISDPAWEIWEAGIKENFDRPQFLAAWTDLVNVAPKQFKKLVDSGVLPEQAQLAAT